MADHLTPLTLAGWAIDRRVDVPLGWGNPLVDFRRALLIAFTLPSDDEMDDHYFDSLRYAMFGDVVRK